MRIRAGKKAFHQRNRHAGNERIRGLERVTDRNQHGDNGMPDRYCVTSIMADRRHLAQHLR
ncbi:unnamed protein product (plasmid) [Mycetohabitans rhizoxinica HKI 454]|uniref:Uncharacterized protein n=1 Tax=Mycetohabitans rhizoxinica (strain DSM 19002 / CIP 109453 / HKI 454) TaxID=882378 RepID=E5ATM9_MYCRK|nr:unnamed protein product [Mycetohabitans rhizoxinica HKI 454]